MCVYVYILLVCIKIAEHLGGNSTIYIPTKAQTCPTITQKHLSYKHQNLEPYYVPLFFKQYSEIISWYISLMLSALLIFAFTHFLLKNYKMELWGRVNFSFLLYDHRKHVSSVQSSNHILPSKKKKKREGHKLNKYRGEQKEKK